MPEADLLGVHFDMQLLAKLTVSAAAILFVTWVFRFYSTRSRGRTRSKKRLPPPGSTQPSPESCRPCKTVFDPLKEKEANDGENRSRQSSVDFGHGICQLQKTDAVVKKEKKNEVKDSSLNREGGSSLFSCVEGHKAETPKFENLVTNTEETSLLFSGLVRNENVARTSEDVVTNAEGNPLSSSGVDCNVTEGKTFGNVLTDKGKENSSFYSGVKCNPEVVDKPEDHVTNTEGNLSPPSGVKGNMECLLRGNKTGLNLMIPNSDVTTSPSGRRSPCQLKKLDGGVEVGRELRQNMGHPGTFSSFQSKAEIKVENADLVIEGPGDRSTAVRGKIYEYFVETSSQSVSDISRTFGVSSGYGTYEANVLDKPRTPSPLPSSLIIRDLEFSVESDKASDRVSIVPRSETGRHLRHRFIRKDSYLAAAAESEVQIPFPPPVTRSRSLQNECFRNSAGSPRQIEEFGLKYVENPQVETVAGAQFFHLPGENKETSEMESLNGKLDLGNCLEALMHAKKDGHDALQQAALRVMSDNYFQVLRDPNLYGRLKAGERDQIQRQRNRGRRCLMVADMDSPDWTRCSLQSADTYTARAASGLYHYDDYSDTWHRQGRIPQEVFSKGCAMCTMDNYLFVAVGFQSAVPSKKVFCYNPMTSIWSEICPMNEARPHCKLVALQDHVYAIGGECLSTVERYDPRTNRWTFVAPLPNDTFAVAHRATACNGELFVSGGTLKYTLLRYNPKNDVWRQSLIVGSKERTTEMISVRNFLYRFDVNPNLGISVYRYHVVAKLWYECCSKQIPHCHSFQCVAMDDIIYCVNRQFTMRFLADEKSPGFVADDLQILSPAKGILFPFVLSLPDKSSLQTSV